MGFSKLKKKNNNTIIIKNIHNGDKIHYTKNRSSGLKISSTIAHEGFYNIETSSASSLIEQTGLVPSKINVLDVGFGLGYSAQKFIDLGIKSYTGIEINDSLYANALHWSLGLNTTTNVSIINGDWAVAMQNLINLGHKYHIIYYGMLDEIGDKPNLDLFMDLSSNLSNIGTLCSVQGLPLFKNIDLTNHSKSNFNIDISGYTFDNIFTWNLYLTLSKRGYFSVYYQYYDGQNWVIDPNEKINQPSPCVGCLPIKF